jgi:mono-ADP-ribosyltransferase sirtuin 6
MALVQLQRENILKYIISQNCDGLHKRSGIHKDRISELHGNSNIEYCENCGKEYLRDYAAHRLQRGRDHYTGRHCVVPCENTGVCNGRLLEYTIDFGQNLPERPLKLAYKHAMAADLHLVLGSSLTVSPACDMPKISKKKGAKLVICNRQKTPLTERADLHIYANTDQVMQAVMARLTANNTPGAAPGISIPRWVLRRRIMVRVSSTSISRKGTVGEIQVTGLDPDDSKLPASVVVGVEAASRKKDGVRFQSTESAQSRGQKQSFKGVPKLKATREPHSVRFVQTSSSAETVFLALRWYGHYDEPNVMIPVQIPGCSSFGTAAASSTSTYLLGFTASMGTWEWLEVATETTGGFGVVPLNNDFMTDHDLSLDDTKAAHLAEEYPQGPCAQYHSTQPGTQPAAQITWKISIPGRPGELRKVATDEEDRMMQHHTRVCKHDMCLAVWRGPWGPFIGGSKGSRYFDLTTCSVGAQLNRAIGWNEQEPHR